MARRYSTLEASQPENKILPLVSGKHHCLPRTAINENGKRAILVFIVRWGRPSGLFQFKDSSKLPHRCLLSNVDQNLRPRTKEPHSGRHNLTKNAIAETVIDGERTVEVRPPNKPKHCQRQDQFVLRTTRLREQVHWRRLQSSRHVPRAVTVLIQSPNANSESIEPASTKLSVPHWMLLSSQCRCANRLATWLLVRQTRSIGVEKIIRQLIRKHSGLSRILRYAVRLA